MPLMPELETQSGKVFVCYRSWILLIRFPSSTELLFFSRGILRKGESPREERTSPWVIDSH